MICVSYRSNYVDEADCSNTQQHAPSQFPYRKHRKFSPLVIQRVKAPPNLSKDGQHKHLTTSTHAMNKYCSSATSPEFSLSLHLADLGYPMMKPSNWSKRWSRRQDGGRGGAAWRRWRRPRGTPTRTPSELPSFSYHAQRHRSLCLLKRTADERIRWPLGQAFIQDLGRLHCLVTLPLFFLAWCGIFR